METVMQNHLNIPSKQRGVVLFVSLIMVVIIGMLTLSLMGMSRIEMRMANNEEARINGLQVAQSMIDVAVSDSKMTPVVGGAEYRLCLGDQTDCDMEIPSTPPDEVNAYVTSDALDFVATRSDPPLRPPVRGSGWSVSFVAAPFRLRATYDRTEDGQGFAEVEQGLEIMIPSL
jgi:hypothetical protein